MAFKEKLENLRLQEERKRELKRALEEEERKNLAEQKERTRAGLEQLEEIAKRELQPLLELVNDVYLGGRGKVGELKRIRYPLIDGDNKDQDNWNNEYGVRLSLSWDPRRRGRGDEGELLEMDLGNNRVTRARGGGLRSPKGFVRMDDRDAKQKLEESVYKILTTPGACTWFRQDPDPH